jgi:hypothetical protein
MVRGSYWIPGSYAPAWSEKRNSFLSLLKNKGFKKESMTKVGLDAISKSTTLESNKSLLHISKEIDDYLTTALYHPKDRWPFLLQCASSTFAFESAATPPSALLLHHFRLTLVAGNHIGFVTFNFV